MPLSKLAASAHRRAEQYRSKASDLRSLAADEFNHRFRGQLLGLARQYEHLADGLQTAEETDDRAPGPAGANRPDGAAGA